jgi:hypothetical protein
VRSRSRAVPNVEIGFDIGILREILTFSRENLIADLARKIFPVLTHEAKLKFFQLNPEFFAVRVESHRSVARFKRSGHEGLYPTAQHFHRYGTCEDQRGL